jgi:hypothetical protein
VCPGERQISLRISSIAASGNTVFGRVAYIPANIVMNNRLRNRWLLPSDCELQLQLNAQASVAEVAPEI